MSKSVSELCREALGLREKAPFRFESIKDENRLFADLDPQYFAFDMPESLANHLAFAANHIKAIAERCLELEEEVEGYRSGNLPTWKSEYDLIKSVCDEVDKNNEELRAENIRLRALVANPNLEEWYLKSENLRMVCIRLARAKTIEKRDQVASKCKHLFSDVKDILRGDEALKGGQGG